MQEYPARTLLTAEKLAYSMATEAGPFPVIEEMSFSIAAGESVGILGPNGCGKTSLLRLLAGIYKSTAGNITLSDHLTSIGMVCQHVNQNLLPWRTAIDNVAIPALLDGTDSAKAKLRAMDVLCKMDLESLARRYPHELSGGQQQLVAIARWVANPPSILLIDEGWSMLDFVQRERVYRILREFVGDGSRSICVVSHNVAELAGVVDRALVFSQRPARVAVQLHFRTNESRAQRVESLWEAARNVFNSSDTESC